MMNELKPCPFCGSINALYLRVILAGEKADERCGFFKNKADFVEVKHGEWNLEVRSFYMDTWDESPELRVYILASCSNCGKEHSPKEVFSMNIYAPEDADFDYRFDREYEETKALEKFKQYNYEFQNFCSHCGADMRKGGADNGKIH